MVFLAVFIFHIFVTPYMNIYSKPKKGFWLKGAASLAWLILIVMV